MSNPFALNKHLHVSVINFDDSVIYEIRNIFQSPQNAIAHIKKQTLNWNKPLQRGLNGKWFQDGRHTFEANIKDLSSLGTRLTTQEFTHPNKIITNCTIFFDRQENDFANNYWWPHIDHGYNGIVYLNDYNGPGTNLYYPVLPRQPRKGEHEQPWNSKQQWNLVKTVQAEFNKFVLFDGAKYYHGMAINDKTWFTRQRLNMVLFYRPVEQK